jgi:hypothetical protein
MQSNRNGTHVFVLIQATLLLFGRLIFLRSLEFPFTIDRWSNDTLGLNRELKAIKSKI